MPTTNNLDWDTLIIHSAYFMSQPREEVGPRSCDVPEGLSHDYLL